MNQGVIAFTSKGSNFWGSSSTTGRFNWESGITPLDLSKRQRLDDILSTVNGLPFGATDCALPMLYTLDKGLKVDHFVVYTDSETWAGGPGLIGRLTRAA